MNMDAGDVASAAMGLATAMAVIAGPTTAGRGSVGGVGRGSSSGRDVEGGSCCGGRGDVEVGSGIGIGMVIGMGCSWGGRRIVMVVGAGGRRLGGLIWNK